MVNQLYEKLNLKLRSEIHLARKIWHISTVSLMFVIYYFAPENISKIILLASWILFVPIDFYRQKNKALNDFLVHFFNQILRKNEVDKLAGGSYLITGVGLVVFFLPRQIVCLTLLFLAFADPLASYIGIRFGKDKIFGQKTIQGFMAAYAVCFLCSFFFLYSTSIPFGRLLAFSLIAGLIGALAELIPIAKLDDNLTLPVLSGTGLYMLFYFFGFLENIL